MYISVDGDNIGQMLTKKIYSNSLEETSRFSIEVSCFFETIKEKVNSMHGEVVFCAGDSIAFKINDELVSNILSNINTESFNVTIGLGKTIKQAHWALNVAKSLGKNRVLLFDEIKSEFLD